VRPVGDHATTGVALLLEQVKRRSPERGDLDHEIVQTLVLAAVQAVG
jgi:hypothetical protein